MRHSVTGHLRQQFHEGLSHVPIATSLIATNGEGGAHAQTGAGLCPMPGDAPAVVVSLNDEDAIVAAIRMNSRFRVNMLTASDDHLADAFISGRPLEDSPLWDTGAAGGPLLRAAAASFACHVTEMRTGGGRVAVVGDIVEVTWRDDAEPLLSMNHRYRRVEDLPLPMFPGLPAAQKERTTSAR